MPVASAEFDAARRGGALARAARPRHGDGAGRGARRRRGRGPRARRLRSGAARHLLGQRHGGRGDLRGDLPHGLRRPPADAADQRRHDHAERAGRRDRARLRRPRRRARLCLRLRLLGGGDRRGDARDPRRLDRRRHRRRQRGDADARACWRAGRRCACSCRSVRRRAMPPRWRPAAGRSRPTRTASRSARRPRRSCSSRRARRGARRARPRRCSPATRPTATACTSPCPTRRPGRARCARARRRRPRRRERHRLPQRARHGDDRRRRGRGRLDAPACFGRAACAVSSTKAIHGHLLGAGGAVELLATLRALAMRALPPTANVDRRRPGVRDRPRDAARPRTAPTACAPRCRTRSRSAAQRRPRSRARAGWTQRGDARRASDRLRLLLDDVGAGRDREAEGLGGTGRSPRTPRSAAATSGRSCRRSRAPPGPCP